GGNYAFLSSFGSVDNVEPFATALAYFSQKNPGIPVFKGGLPDTLPEAICCKRYDLITLFDVLEHIEEDEKSLQVLSPLLTAQGKILLTVPACPFLYGVFDKNQQHFRRYTRSSLQQVIQRAGLSLHFISYWNFFLFPAMVLRRLSEKHAKNFSPEEEFALPCFPLNQLAYSMLLLEKFLLPTVRFPIGGSLIALISKKGV
ncbi:MAG: class I SAM-dependent methyltransferase, partial [Holosporales bacterium]|nr:class I SAM-dependent methyltransferase [Holosporales bacterium]